MYVRGYLQGSENGRVVTIGCAPPPLLDPALKSVYYIYRFYTDLIYRFYIDLIYRFYIDFSLLFRLIKRQDTVVEVTFNRKSSSSWQSKV